MITKIKHAANNSYIITYDNGMATHCAVHNREYAQVELWLADGNTIEEEETAAELAAKQHAEKQAALAATDGDMARLGEDLITILIDKGVISMSDFSGAAQNKISNRAALRTAANNGGA